jgi:uroporphyrinogen decarboxylase
MNDRQRTIAALRFQKPDRVPFNPGYGRKSTREAWHRQGCPADKEPHAYARELASVPPATTMKIIHPGVDFRMIPQFEEKVLERRPGTLVVQDWKGNICEISDEFDVSYLREAVDFVTRSWIKCPVESRADWEDMARRYDVNDAKRFPADWTERCRQLQARDYASRLIFSGPFWQLREWLGFENLCVAFLDDPDFVREMIGFWQSFVTRQLTKMFEGHVPDIVLVNEDMAYKEKPMIGPDMCRQFLLPCWREWAEVCRAAGVPVYELDSDGNVSELIPVWIEAGIQSNSPQEVAAGNDLPAYRQRYGTQMAYQGGVDKRAMAKGGAVLRAEIARLQPVIDAGGFIPSCDHGIPHDVSWPNFVEYNRLLAGATGWR